LGVKGAEHNSSGQKASPEGNLAAILLLRQDARSLGSPILEWGSFRVVWIQPRWQTELSDAHSNRVVAIRCEPASLASHLIPDQLLWRARAVRQNEDSILGE